MAIEEENVTLSLMSLIGIRSILLGDKGFLSRERKKRLRLHGVDLQTPRRIIMIETRTKIEVRTSRRIRHFIEAVIGIFGEIPHRIH